MSDSRKMSKAFYFASLLVFAGGAKDRGILADYYWGSNELRSRTSACDMTVLRVRCFEQCGEDYICENDECKCTENHKPIKISLRTADDYLLYPYQDNQYLYSKEFDIPQVLRTAIEEDAKPEDTKLQEEIYETIEHSDLRHHIAHFCPNLKKARTCIRGCMKLGKPAFCGKDHVCYCGHRYTSHDEKKKVDITDMYAEFRDIYEKYFGPQIFENPNYSDEDSEGEGEGNADAQLTV